MTRATILKMAATVILARPTDSAEFEVFLTRKPADMEFAGDMAVFPGGALQIDDSSEAMLARCRGVAPEEARRVLGTDLTPEIALGHWVAGIRELYQEVGILLAVPEQGKVRAPANIAASSDGFRSLLEIKGLICDAARMAYFSHWQTPEHFSIRFHTRFFLAFMPENQTSFSASREVAHSSWLTPNQALTLFGRGDLPIIFPTFASLRALADFDSLDSLAREYKLRVVS